jgi:hypothetical protein
MCGRYNKPELHACGRNVEQQYYDCCHDKFGDRCGHRCKRGREFCHYYDNLYERRGLYYYYYPDGECGADGNNGNKSCVRRVYQLT